MKKSLKIIGLIFFICLIFLILTLQIVNSQKIAFGLKIASPNNQSITLSYQDKNWLVNLSNLGFQLDSQTTLEKAYQISHPSNFLTQIKNQTLALFGYYNLKPIYNINLDKFQEETIQLFENIEKPAQNANLVFSNELDDFVLEHSDKGTTIDRKQLIDDLSDRANSLSNQSINLQLIIDYPSIENDEVGTAQEKAQQIIASQPYYLIHEISTLTINKQTLIDWIKFRPVKEQNSDNEILEFFLDQEKLEEYLSKISAQINRPIQNAQLKTENNKATTFVPPQDGFEVKKDLTYQKLMENLLSDPPIKNTYVISDKATPEIKLSQTNRLGIDQLIGQGVSNFSGSPNNRKHNIKTAVNKLNGYILSPDEEFSFNGFLGETGPEQGYLSELVIKKNKTVPEYGGGACQVSTTFFRAAINSGLKITERQNHSFPVAYYNPQGFDATVYDPKPDLRFVNNTPNHLLIESYVSGNQVFVNFYATDDKRTVKVKGPYILESNEDGSMKAVLTQEVYKLSGEELEKQIFYSNYKSPNLYPVETGE